MAYWTSLSTPKGTVWRRPLGAAESAFYWDTVLAGSTDIMHHDQIDVAAPHLEVMNIENIRQAWLAVKRKYPLLAARIIRKEDRGTDDAELYFEVAEDRVLSIPDGELTIGHIDSLDDIPAFTEHVLNGPRQLLPDQNVKIIIKSFQEPSQDQIEIGYWTRYHVWLLCAHTISDGGANMSLFSTLMIMMTTPSQRISKGSIGQCLSRAANAETLHFSPKHSLARLRWRKAIAYAIMQVREAHIKVSLSQLGREAVPINA
jgi:hypothetical protein